MSVGRWQSAVIAETIAVVAFTLSITSVKSRTLFVPNFQLPDAV
jgi:hypothetical protein